MKTVYKISQKANVIVDGVCHNEWFCSTDKLAIAFKAKKENLLHVADGYSIIPVEVMESEEDFYKKELR